MSELVAACLRSLEDGPVSSGATAADAMALFPWPLPDDGPEVPHGGRGSWAHSDGFLPRRAGARRTGSNSRIP